MLTFGQKTGYNVENQRYIRIVVVTFFQGVLAIFVAPTLRCSMGKYICCEILVAIGSPPSEIEGYPPPILPPKFRKMPILSMKLWIERVRTLLKDCRAH